MSEENKAIMRRAVEEIFSAPGNLDIADELYAPNYVAYGGPADPEDIRGPEGVKEQASMYRNAFPDVRLIIEDQVAEGDKVATRYTASGTHRGELMGIAPTGNRVEIKGISITRIEDGKIVEDWEIFDAMGMMQQLGHISAPG